MRSRSGRNLRVAVSAAAVVLIALGLGAGARPAQDDQITITLFASNLNQAGYQVLIANFERVYPNITVNGSYPTNAALTQLEPIELAAGNAPDLLATSPGCTTSISICELAQAGDLAPMLKVPWAQRSLPLVTSLDKYHGALLGFEPGASLEGMFTNDTLFKRLGLTLPQTFSQLLGVCQKAKAAGVVAVFLAGTTEPGLQSFVDDLAVPYVYGVDKHWVAELNAGTVSFDGSAGWRRALQEFVDMSNAGCFEPGMTGTADGTQFAAGQILMAPYTTSQKSVIDAADPQFSYSFHPFPGGSAPNATEVFAQLGQNLSINAHSSPAAQAAAQTFINFVARPKQNALLNQITGGLTQYQLLKGEVPPWMPAMAPVMQHGEYVMNPSLSFENASVGAAIRNNVIGLFTGQATIDGILTSMDAAWKLGPG